MCSQDFSIEGRSGGGAPSRRRQGGLDSVTPAFDDFCNFSIKIMHFYTKFGQNSYFKVITHQLKAFKISLKTK